MLFKVIIVFSWALCFRHVISLLFGVRLGARRCSCDLRCLWRSWDSLGRLGHSCESQALISVPDSTARTFTHWAILPATVYYSVPSSPVYSSPVCELILHKLLNSTFKKVDRIECGLGSHCPEGRHAWCGRVLYSGLWPLGSWISQHPFSRHAAVGLPNSTAKPLKIIETIAKWKCVPSSSFWLLSLWFFQGCVFQNVDLHLSRGQQAYL